MDLSNRIRSKALDLGFDLVGIAPAHAARHAGAFRAWLRAGYAGEMDWLSRDPERRIHPDRVLPGAQSVVAVGWSYFVEEPPRAVWDDPSRGRIARYAWGPDYHDRITPLLKDLAAFIRAESDGRAQTRYYVDTGPVLEREMAARAGLGFVGKNTMLIHPDYGSYLFLAEILVDAVLEPDAPATDDGAAFAAPLSGPNQRPGTCGSCRRCIDICPTHAFPAAYVLDSNRCISYLTIELRGAIPVELRPKMKNWIFGCDECQSACPWVKQYSRPNDRAFLRPDPDRMAPSLTRLISLTEEEFRYRFRRTPVLRAKRRGLLRNVAVALGNWGDPAAGDALRAALRDEEPLIREHAAWALNEIDGRNR